MQFRNKLSIPFLLSLIIVMLWAAPAGMNSIAQAGVLATQPVLAGSSNHIYLPLIAGRSVPIVGSTLPAPSTTPFPTYTPFPTPTKTPTPAPTPTKTPKPTVTSTPGSGSATLLAAGDIARCGDPGSTQTAAIISKIPGTVVALGDNAYESGSLTEYQTCYDPSWGQFISRTMPVPGNHDYITTDAAGYFAYFGDQAGNPANGYYSYNLGSWHILALNSNCSLIGGCGKNSPQETFVRNDLAAHPTACTLAYWHHPRFSSGEWGDITWTQTIVQDLYNAGAEIILSGHDHDYERFAPQDPLGNLDLAKGIVQFVVGTGGSNNTPWTIIQPNSLARQNTDFGVLQLTLNPTSYSWKYLPTAGSFSDSGSAACH